MSDRGARDGYVNLGEVISALIHRLGFIILIRVIYAEPAFETMRGMKTETEGGNP